MGNPNHWLDGTTPSIRGVTDVAHRIVAAASSTDTNRARSFLANIGAPTESAPYAELVRDQNVNIIYVATPHSHHFQNVMLAIQAGKPLAVNARQARRVFEAARTGKVFLMEAVWIRFFPLSIQIRELVSTSVIGHVVRVIADLSHNHSAEDPTKLNVPDSHRLTSIELVGGSLLDIGIYAVSWIFQLLYHLQAGDDKEMPQVLASSHRYSTGVDKSTAAILSFVKHENLGIATSSLQVATDPDGHANHAAVRIQGTRGEIEVAPPTYRPESYKVMKRDGRVEVVKCTIPQDPERKWGYGTFWEADECARCIRDGRLESVTMPHSESICVVEVLDTIRQQSGIEYPDLITTEQFDPQSPLNGGKG
ncbi:uncharacterized protein Z518_10155 [Rhinocladiella mackenziei CBS 650.93]|uniref:D-xylose 1-dehydrogenase (NADP(+), D-xylono-1,5-lactone-forming) n=1 Tax=Rhinocladiella mackenziei CBS 650.93 TaxID=1442369 RepID=A0A0D2I5M5_9EURO|nr:uncharacterized protein Z518_10155 [Rhinocladiella mackenziei CBS 650.93]KIX01089.1 hypothetical protein Z518_10155 [Rhinocladiella mackenziei CBS 650.93]